jgi:predicted double-glycine peptidase
MAMNWLPANPRQTVMSTYVQKFGQLPEGLHKLMANMGLIQQMYQLMETALESNQPVIWNDHIKPFGRGTIEDRMDSENAGILFLD